MTDHSEDGGPPTTALLVTTDGRRRYLTFNRPEVLNALNRELTRAFATAVKEFTLDDSVHVAIINGAGGRSFSTGGDLKEMSTRIDGPAARGGHDVPTAESVPWYGPLLRCDKPVVAAIDGYCIAAGFELSLLCDIRLATRQSVFGLPEPRRSMMAGPALHHLSRMIPLGEAMRIHLTGSPIAAQRAYEIGLVQGLSEDSAGLATLTDEIVNDILACSPLALRSIKQVIRAGNDASLDQSWQVSIPLQERLLNSQDAVEGTRAFVERRSPRWTGT